MSEGHCHWLWKDLPLSLLCVEYESTSALFYHLASIHLSLSLSLVLYIYLFSLTHFTSVVSARLSVTGKNNKLNCFHWQRKLHCQLCVLSARSAVIPFCFRMWQIQAEGLQYESNCGQCGQGFLTSCTNSSIQIMWLLFFLFRVLYGG